MITPEEYGQLASLMDGVFRFKVGDIVQAAALGDYVEAPAGHSTSTNKPESWYEISISGASNYRYQIIERWLQQCHGGIQKHYHVRLVDNRGLVEGPCRILTQDELTASKPYRRIRSTSKMDMMKWVLSLPDDAPTTAPEENE